MGYINIGKRIYGSEFHSDIPRAPYDGAEVADFVTVADQMDMFALRCSWRRMIADGHDDIVTRNLFLTLVFPLYNDIVLADFLCAGFKIDRNMIGLETVAQIGGVCKAEILDGHEVILHLYDNRMFALAEQVESNFAAGQTAADDDDVVAHRLFLQEVVAGVHGIFHTLNWNAVCRGTGGNDNFICIQGFNILDLGVHLDGDVRILLALTDIPLNEFLVILLEGRGSGCNENAAELVGLLINGDFMAAQSRNTCGLHTANAAADNRNILLLLGGTILYLL